MWYLIVGKTRKGTKEKKVVWKSCCKKFKHNSQLQYLPGKVLDCGDPLRHPVTKSRPLYVTKLSFLSWWNGQQVANSFSLWLSSILTDSWDIWLYFFISPGTQALWTPNIVFQFNLYFYLNFGLKRYNCENSIEAVKHRFFDKIEFWCKWLTLQRKISPWYGWCCCQQRAKTEGRCSKAELPK